LELYAEPLNDAGRGERDEPVKVVMDRGEELVGAVNGFIYLAKASAERP
jgi:hypothetical protein